MRWVAHAAGRPHECAVIPGMGNARSQKGFIDSGRILPGWDPHVYVSVEAVEEMARMIGWAPNIANEMAQRKVKEMKAQVADRDDQIKVLKEQLEAVHTLRNAGFKAKERTIPKGKVAA